MTDQEREITQESDRLSENIVDELYNEGYIGGYDLDDAVEIANGHIREALSRILAWREESNEPAPS